LISPNQNNKSLGVSSFSLFEEAARGKTTGGVSYGQYRGAKLLPKNIGSEFYADASGMNIDPDEFYFGAHEQHKPASSPSKINTTFKEKYYNKFKKSNKWGLAKSAGRVVGMAALYSAVSPVGNFSHFVSSGIGGEIGLQVAKSKFGGSLKSKLIGGALGSIGGGLVGSVLFTGDSNRIKGIQPGANKFPAMPTEGAWSSDIREELTEFKKGFASKKELWSMLSSKLMGEAKKKALVIPEAITKAMPGYQAVTLRGKEAITDIEGLIQSNLKGREREAARKAFTGFSKDVQALETEYPILINPKLVKKSAKVRKISMAEELESTYVHERMHQTIRETPGLKEKLGRAYGQLPEEFISTYQQERAAVGDTMLKTEDYVEEFLAYTVGSRMLKKARFGKKGDTGVYSLFQDKGVAERGERLVKEIEKEFSPKALSAMSDSAKQVFRDSSQNSVGIGIRQAHKATTGHAEFYSAPIPPLPPKRR